MKKVFAAAVLILVTGVSVFAQYKQGGNAWVATKTVELKSSTGFFASNQGTLSYGDQVSVLQVSGKWVQVRSANNTSLSGWVSGDNLSPNRIVSTGTSTATAGEVSMAGRGFNQEVENKYRGDGTYNYADVDKTEALVVSEDELYRFVTTGHLIAGE